MNLDRPVAPDPYDLLPRVGSFSLKSDDVRDGAPMAAAHALSGANLSRNCRGVARPRRPRVTPSPASIPTRRRPPASGTGSRSTCRRMCFPSLEERGRRTAPAFLAVPSIVATITARWDTAVPLRRRVIGRTGTTSWSMRWMSRGLVSPRTPRRRRCPFNWWDTRSLGQS